GVAASEKWEARTRRVTVNPTALPQTAALGGTPSVPGSQVTIDLFDGATITAVFERWDPNTSGVTWVGRVPGQEGSHVTLVYGGGKLAASIVLRNASYTIKPLPIDPSDPAPPTDTHVLTEIND